MITKGEEYLVHLKWMMNIASGCSKQDKITQGEIALKMAMSLV